VPGDLSKRKRWLVFVALSGGWHSSPAPLLVAGQRERKYRVSVVLIFDICRDAATRHSRGAHSAMDYPEIYTLGKKSMSCRFGQSPGTAILHKFTSTMD
jgi:hypothetical protein